MVEVWDAASGKELLALKGHIGTVVAAAFSPDGRRIVTGSSDSTAVATTQPKCGMRAIGKELLTLKGHRDPVQSVAFSPDGHRIVTGSWDGTAKVWDAASPAQVAAWQKEEKAAAESLAAFPGSGSAH